MIRRFFDWMGWDYPIYHRWSEDGNRELVKYKSGKWKVLEYTIGGVTGGRTLIDHIEIKLVDEEDFQKFLIKFNLPERCVDEIVYLYHNTINKLKAERKAKDKKMKDIDNKLKRIRRERK